MEIGKKIEAKGQIKELVERFEENISQYKRANYGEANTRADFIDPFFESLGWDVANKQGYAEQYREVVREAKVIIAGKHKAPDYSFRIGGIRKFFVEAKKPSVDLKSEISPAYQLRRYAYTAKLPLSILTDFDEFSVYDTRIKPTPKDSASCARIFYCGYKDYLKNFDFIYDTFSKEGILRGSFDRYIESTKNKKGTSEVDKEFLKLIDKWREKLAKNIALRNKSLTLYELNFAIQKIIDRIIFLRITEDRQIEDYGKLQILLNGTNTYRRLMEIFLHSDKKYNSGLFDFEKDEITPGLSVDDKVIKEILKSVYYPESPYEFSVLDVEILGNIYEQFLGKTIRLTPAHQVKVEERPEVKKAGGVYYTPKYIVDYIVKNTVGEIIKGKTPKQIDKIKILDPACGSGSFLLGAYQHLLNYHLERYSKDENYKKALKKGQIIQTGKDSFQLTIAEKQRILLNNIFGVDIDTQAVEVSKLSLLLKLLEGETEESTRQLFRYTQMKLLPDLSNNIKCGNSLIGPDFYDTQQATLFDEAEMRRINVFDWKSAFPDIFQNGGFDVVIGNPPYVFTRELIKETEKEYYNQYYEYTHFKINTYLLFVERGFNLLNQNGMLSYIIPNNWLTLETTSEFRRFILTKTFSINIVDNRDKVFESASVDTCILSFSMKGKREITAMEFEGGALNLIAKSNPSMYLDLHNYTISYEILKSEHALTLCKKIGMQGIKLIALADVKNGIQAYTVGEGTPKQTEEMKKQRVYHSFEKKDGSWLKYVDGVDVGRYYLGWSKQFVKYGKNLTRPRKPGLFKRERLLVRQIPGQPPCCILACYVLETLVNDNNSMIIKKYDDNYDLKYLLGILNSKLMSFWFIYTFGKLQRKIFPQFKIKELSTFPIKTIDFSISHEKAMHDKLVSMVDKMLELQKKFHSTRLESDKKMYKTQIDVLDNQIDSLVYKLYGLAEEEIKIIESQ